MKVLVTGGTGFVGCHTVSRLVRDGHEIRMLVRSEDRVSPALIPVGVNTSQVEVLLGDVTDRDSIKRALVGVDALIHAASVYTMDKRRSKEIMATNKKGAEIVLGEASIAGLDPIIYVSSVAAVMSPEKSSVRFPVSPPTSVKIGAYVNSKADQEVIARDLQAKGAPIVITYPGSVAGPYDPHWGDGTLLVENVLCGKANPVIDGNIPIVDVRDIARLHSAVLEPAKGPRRYMLSGNSIRLTELVALLGRLTGRNIRCHTAPIWLLEPIGNAMDVFQTIWPIRFRISKEAFTILKWDLGFDDSSSVKELGIKKTDLETTMIDMLRGMHSVGRISDKMLGKLA